MVQEAASTTNDDMTPEERLQWLRDRGVQIETAEERNASSLASPPSSSKNNNNEDDDETFEFISFVYLPADASQPPQQLTLPVPLLNNKSNDSDPTTYQQQDYLTEYLKPMFSTDHVVDLELFRKGSGSGGGGGSTSVLCGNDATRVSEEALHQVASKGNVEVFRLVSPVEQNKYVQVNIYLDEIGMLKRLPVNTRASQFAARAGFNPPPTFYGNVYLGRVKHKKPSHFQNVDLTVKETFLDAPWLVHGAAQNIQFQTELNKLTGKVGELQPLVDGTEGREKEEGSYSWTQTEEDLEIKVSLPSTTSKRHIQVKFLPSSLQIFTNNTNENTIRIDFFDRIDPDGCTWTLENLVKRNTGDDSSQKQMILVITCEKINEMTWPRITK